MVSDPLKKHSAEMTDGPSRAPARAMLKAIGYTDQDLAKPIIGVATTWIETMPCNYNQRELAQLVKEGIREAGGTPGAATGSTPGKRSRASPGHRRHGHHSQQQQQPARPVGSPSPQHGRHQSPLGGAPAVAVGNRFRGA